MKGETETQETGSPIWVGGKERGGSDAREPGGIDLNIVKGMRPKEDDSSRVESKSKWSNIIIRRVVLYKDSIYANVAKVKGRKRRLLRITY